MSVDAARAEVVRYRELAKADPVTYEPELGLALYALCMELREVAGPITTSYIRLLEEGIALHRRLLRLNPSSIPQLGLMLCWLGGTQYILGWIDKARDLLEEGLGLLRRMEHDQPKVYQTQVAYALSLLSFVLGKTGDHSTALSAAREAVAIWRQLVDEQPEKHDHDLAAALHTLCHALQDAHRDDEILAPAEESVRIVRHLRAHASDSVYARLLANGLDLQVAALGNGGRWQEALPMADEAVRCYQEARKNGDRCKTLNYAAALYNLSKILWLLGRESDAKYRARMAMNECMWRARDTDSHSELASAASDIAEVMTSLGMTRSAQRLTKYVNARLTGQPYGLGKLIASLRRR